jgi:hypothetical protein
MKRRSPTLEGFQALFRLPALGLAEIAWRWSFGLAVTALLAFSFREYLSTLPVTAAEMFLLQTRQPALMLQVIARILQGSAPRAVTALMVLALAVTLAWIVLASLGRAATLKTLFAYFRENDESKPRTWRLTSLMGLNFLRAGALLAALVGSVGAVLLAGATSSKTDPSPGSALLIFWMLALFIGLAWSMLNWFLSLAAIFVVGDERTIFGALAAAADLCRSRRGAVLAAAAWFGIAHAVAFVSASSVSAFPLAFAEVLPAGMILGGVILVALIYFAIADFLYVGRLAAYVFLIDVRESETQPSALSIQPPAPASDDDILSDIPGLTLPPQPASG